MVVLGIVAIVASIATPSWRSLLVSNRIRSVSNDIVLAASVARSEAVRRNAPVTFCPSNNGKDCTATGYEQGWLVQTQAGVLVQDFPPVDSVTVDNNQAAPANGIVYLPTGTASAAFTGYRLEVKSTNTADVALTRYICAGLTGRLTVYKPTISNGVPVAPC